MNLIVPYLLWNLRQYSLAAASVSKTVNPSMSLTCTAYPSVGRELLMCQISCVLVLRVVVLSFHRGQMCLSLYLGLRLVQ